MKKERVLTMKKERVSTMKKGVSIIFICLHW